MHGSMNIKWEEYQSQDRRQAGQDLHQPFFPIYIQDRQSLVKSVTSWGLKLPLDHTSSYAFLL